MTTIYKSKGCKGIRQWVIDTLILYIPNHVTHNFRLLIEKFGHNLFGIN